MSASGLICVGEYVERFNALTGQSLPCAEIYRSPGLIVHVRNHHPGTEANVALIPQIIASPDYVGKHPREPNSIELVKVFSNNVMVCIKLDVDENYLYVASVFEITDSKIRNRLNSGRLQRY